MWFSCKLKISPLEIQFSICKALILNLSMVFGFVRKHKRARSLSLHLPFVRVAFDKSDWAKINARKTTTPSSRSRLCKCWNSMHMRTLFSKHRELCVFTWRAVRDAAAKEHKIIFLSNSDRRRLNAKLFDVVGWLDIFGIFSEQARKQTRCVWIHDMADCLEIMQQSEFSFETDLRCWQLTRLRAAAEKEGKSGSDMCMAQFIWMSNISLKICAFDYF